MNGMGKKRHTNERLKKSRERDMQSEWKNERENLERARECVQCTYTPSGPQFRRIIRQLADARISAHKVIIISD